MTLTTALKTWLVEHKGLSADADDTESKKAAADALIDGSLNQETFTKLTTEPEVKEANDFMAKMDAKFAAIETTMEKMADTIVKMAQNPEPKPEPEPVKLAEDPPKMPDIGDAVKSAEPAKVKHITAASRYSTTKMAAVFPQKDDRGTTHRLAGQRIKEGERPLDHSSELDRAIMGAFIKARITGQTRGVPGLALTDHDKELLEHALQNYKWGGVIGGICETTPGATAVKNRLLTPAEQKAIAPILYETGGSGGVEINPIVFDDEVILDDPLLHSEFYQYVYTKPVTRGTKVEGAMLKEVTLNSNQAEGSAITLTDVANFCQAFDTTIFVVAGGIEIGLDLLSDTPVDLAGHVTASFGRVLLKWLDEQICIGDGTAEPLGIKTNLGHTDVSAATGGSWAVGDLEALLFGVPKQRRQPSAKCMYGATEDTYSRIRGLPVGAADERRVFGMTHEDYMIFNHRFGINESLANADMFFFNAEHYRMYRRLGITIDVETGGKELKTKNLMLVTCRARYGGQIENSAYATYISDGDATA